MAVETDTVKTVFLFLRMGFSNRNLLRTDFLKTLKQDPVIRIVIFSPIGDEAEFRREFEAANVRVEKWPRTKVGFWEKRLKNLKFYVWLAEQKDETAGIKCRSQEGPLGYLWRCLMGKCLLLLNVGQRRISRWAIRVFRPDPAIREIYDRYRPDLVLMTRAFGTNLHVIKEAQRRMIRTVCLVESWDNLTSKGPLSVIPDRLIVWNEINKEEARRLHCLREQDVIVGGVPQFDLYKDESLFGAKEGFFRELNIDRNAKLITYATCVEGNSPEEIETVEALYGAIRNGEIRGPCHLLVRLHPISSRKLVDQYRSRFEGKPGISIQRPGRPSKLHDGWDPTVSDMIELAQTLYHSDVLVNVASTITIDAAYLDTPIVCVAFDGRDKRKDYFNSCRRIYDFSCWRHVVRTAGVRMAFHFQEMIQWINAYLEEPSLDADGRLRIKQQQAQFLDGRSAERMAGIVLRELQRSQESVFREVSFPQADKVVAVGEKD